MIFPGQLAILLLSLLGPMIKAHPLEATNGVPSTISGSTILAANNALAERQIVSKLWDGYRVAFLWSAGIISTTPPTNAPYYMNQFYAHVSDQAKKAMNAFSIQNPQRQPQGIWEFYQNNLHFTAIALNGGTLSFPLMTYALSRLGRLAQMGWTEHFTAVFRDTGTNSAMLVNVVTTHSIDGVLLGTILRGYNAPSLYAACRQLVDSHSDASDKPCVDALINGSHFLSQRISY